MARSSSAVLKFTCVMSLMCTVMVAPYAEAAITCLIVDAYLSPCVSYLRGRGGSVPPPCCKGVKGLNNAARSTPDRKTVCRCLKEEAGKVRNLNLAGALPGRCGVNIPYKISPSTNCNNVK